MCGCVWFLVDFVVCPCVGLFDFWLILWCVVVVVVVGGHGLWWWCLAVLSCGDVGGGAEFVWLAVGLSIAEIMGWRERVRGRENVRGEKKYIKIMYRKATVMVHICTVTITVLYICTLLQALMWVFFIIIKMCKIKHFLYFANFCNHWCGCSYDLCMLFIMCYDDIIRNQLPLYYIWLDFL